MDSPFWLRLLTFGYAKLRRATRIDILGQANFEVRRDVQFSNQLSEGRHFRLSLFSPQHYPEKERFEG